MINRIRLESIIKINIFALSVFVGIYMYSTGKNSPGYEMYFWVPIIYGILVVSNRNIEYTNYHSIGTFILYITMFVRYVVLPVVLHLGNYSSRFGVFVDSKYIENAIWLSIYEMVVVYFFCNYLSKRYSRFYHSEDETHTLREYRLRNNKLFHWICFFLGILAVMLYPELLSEYRFLFDTTNIAINVIVDFPLSGLFKTFFLLGRTSLIILIIITSYKKHENSNKWRYIFFSLLAIIANATFNSNLSRISMLVPLLTFGTMLLNLYSKKREQKFIVSFVSSGIFLGVIFTSIVKFFGSGRGELVNSTNPAWWGDTLNMYFMGVKEISIGLLAQELVSKNYGINRVALFLNDFFSNVIFFSNFTIKSINSTSLFNLTYFGSSISTNQILPNICVGSYYFSVYFAPIWSLVFVYLTFKFSLKAYQSKYIDLMFIYIFPAIYCGMFMMINSSMIIYSMINISLIYYIFIYFNRKIVWKANR